MSNLIHLDGIFIDELFSYTIQLYHRGNEYVVV